MGPIRNLSSSLLSGFDYEPEDLKANRTEVIGITPQRQLRRAHSSQADVTFLELDVHVAPAAVAVVSV